VLVPSAVALAVCVGSILLVGSLSNRSRPIAGGEPQASVVRSATESAEAAIRAAVDLALRTHQTIALPAPDATASIEPISNADLAQQKDASTAIIAQVFSGKLAVTETQGLQNLIDMEQTGLARIIAGGINNLNITSVDIDSAGIAAIVKGTVEAWLRTAQKQQDGSWHVVEPHNTLVFTMSLVSESSRWMADSFDWTFAPGSEP
jgi:hypothetical protein